MMPASAAPQRSDNDLLDLVLLGLTWVQEANPGKFTGWTGNGVLTTFKQMGAVSMAQLRTTGMRFQLIQHVQAVTHVERGTPGHGRLRSLMDGSDKLLIAIVDSPQFVYASLVGPRGYRLLATDAGVERAHRQMSRFAPLVTKDGFMGAWSQHTRAMRGMHATAGDR